MNNTSIIKCETSDWQNLQRVAIETFRHTYQHKNEPIHFEKYIEKSFCDEQVKTDLANPLMHFFFVKIENVSAGYFKLNEAGGQSDLNKPGSLEIERIYVYQKLKGQGIGRKMIRFSLAFAKKRGLKEIWLGVWDQNPAAIAFYEKMGFEKFGTHSFMIGADEQTDYLLRIKTL